MGYRNNISTRHGSSLRMRFGAEVCHIIVYKDKKEVPMGAERKTFHIMRFNLCSGKCKWDLTSLI